MSKYKRLPLPYSGEVYLSAKKIVDEYSKVLKWNKLVDNQDTMVSDPLIKIAVQNFILENVSDVEYEDLCYVTTLTFQTGKACDPDSVEYEKMITIRNVTVCLSDADIITEYFKYLGKNSNEVKVSDVLDTDFNDFDKYLKSHDEYAYAYLHSCDKDSIRRIYERGC